MIIILLGIATSSNEDSNWGWMVLYIAIYFVYVPVVYKIASHM